MGKEERSWWRPSQQRGRTRWGAAWVVEVEVVVVEEEDLEEEGEEEESGAARCQPGSTMGSENPARQNNQI